MVYGSTKLLVKSWKKKKNYILNCSVTPFSLIFVKLQGLFFWRRNFTMSNQSQHCSEESFSTLLQREEAFMWSENTRLIFFSLPMKRCCSNSQSELSQFTSLSPITFTWVWMSLAAENLALREQGDKVPWPAVPECPIFIYCIHAHLLKMRYSRANIFQNRCHIYNIYTFVHTYLYSCDVQKFKKNVHIYYKIVTKTGQCFAHSGKMKLSNNTTPETIQRLWQYLYKQSDILALSLVKLPFKNRRGSKMKKADLAHVSKWNTRRIFT